MKNNTKHVLGLLLVVFGIVFLLTRLGIIPVNLFFDGWWTFLLIIPAAYSMLKTGVSTGNAVVLAIGIFFFLEENGWNFRGIFVPVIVIVFGLALLLKKE